MNIHSILVTFDDGSTQTLTQAVEPTETVDVMPGETVEVVAEAAGDAPAVAPTTDGTAS